ncbi:MAG: hypothetical protein AAFQ87_07215 [Bacteroidota bacterium]
MSGDSTSAGSAAKAGAAGGGIGTAIAALAEQMPDSSLVKPVLLILSPLIAVGISGSWLLIKEAYVDPLRTKKRYASIDELLDAAYEEASKQYELVSNDPNATEDHKREVREVFEKIGQQRLEKLSKRIQLVDLSS